jgi:hypothetical protein
MMSKTSLRTATLVIALASIAVSACSGEVPMSLEAKDVQSFKVSAAEVDHSTTLHLSGLAFHSALAVDKLTQTQDGDTFRLTVSLVPARPGLSGSFDYRVEIPKGTSLVTFGDERKVIWQRRAAR